jgi:hypothetical protein
MPTRLLVGAIPKDALIETIISHLGGRNPDISTAWLIAASAFHGHKDRSGQPYVNHLAQVLIGGTRSNKKIIVGILHDLLEDTEWTVTDLRRVGFSDEIITAIDHVTKQPDELYFDFIVRCGRSFEIFGPDHLAIDPKIADLSHNMSIDRQDAFLTKHQLKKLRVYTVARNYLVAIKSGKIQPGTSVAEFMRLRPKLRDDELLHENEVTGA